MKIRSSYLLYCAVAVVYCASKYGSSFSTWILQLVHASIMYVFVCQLPYIDNAHGLKT